MRKNRSSIRQGRAPLAFVLALAAAAIGAGASRGESAEPAATSRDAAVLRSVLAKVEQFYVDPSRVDPNRMLWAAAAALDREIPEVLLESQPGAEELKIRVSGENKSFPAADVRSMARLFDTLREVLRFVDAHRVPDDRSAAEYAAANGILDSLDPHSILFTPAEARQFDTQIGNEISGIGVVLDFFVNPPAVKSAMKGGPAAGAGVAACDRLLAVDGVSTDGKSIDEVIDHILGPVGTAVWLTFDRDGTGLRDLILTRQKIVLSSVTSRMLEGDVGYIEIEHFARRTASEVEAAIAELKKAGARAWVVDLRRNPGGLLDEAVWTASLFIPSGPVVTTVARREWDTRAAKRQHPIPAEDGPLAVLVSEGSASASEVAAAALQNRNRAVVLGRTSFGKGTVQVLYDQTDGGKLKLSIAHYVTPGGFSLQSRGVVPDIELVPLPAPRPGRVRLSTTEREREVDLERAFRPRTPAVRPEFSMRYVAATPNRGEEVEIARALLLELPAASPAFTHSGAGVNTRTAALFHARVFVEERRAATDERIVRVLGEAGVDWSAGSAAKSPRVIVQCAQRAGAGGVTVIAPAKDAAAVDGEGERVAIDCDVRNVGEGDAFRVFGRAPSLSLDLPGDEIVIGRVAAGESRRVSMEGFLSENRAARVTYVPFAFSEEGGTAVTSVPVRVEAPARPTPAGADGPKGPDIRIEVPAETSAAMERLRAEVPDPAAAVRDAWVRVSHRGSHLDRKKVTYAVRGDAPAGRFELTADVPLGPGANEIEVCARGKEGRRCETAFVFRREAEEKR